MCLAQHGIQQMSQPGDIIERLSRLRERLHALGVGTPTPDRARPAAASTSPAEPLVGWTPPTQGSVAAEQATPAAKAPARALTLPELHEQIRQWRQRLADLAHVPEFAEPVPRNLPVDHTPTLVLDEVAESRADQPTTPTPLPASSTAVPDQTDGAAPSPRGTEATAIPAAETSGDAAPTVMDAETAATVPAGPSLSHESPEAPGAAPSAVAAPPLSLASPVDTAPEPPTASTAVPAPPADSIALADPAAPPALAEPVGSEISPPLTLADDAPPADVSAAHAELRDLWTRLHHRRAEPADAEHLVRYAGQLIEAVDRRCYPLWTFRRHADLTDRLVEHAHNVAETVAFLAASDARWRLERFPLVLAALVQDVGMLEVDEAALNEPAIWEEEEIPAALADHPRLAADKLEPLFDHLPVPEDWLTWLETHHERLDGTGYPRGEEGDAIPAAATLLAVADVFVALRSHRPHRPPRPSQVAFSRILHEAEANRLDADWAARLLNLSLYPVGSRVRLLSGEVAEVIAPQRVDSDLTLAALPFVKVLTSPAGQPLPQPLFRNLAQTPDNRIVGEYVPIDAAVAA